MTRPLPGIQPDRRESRIRYQQERSLRFGATIDPIIVQPIMGIRSQLSNPSCGGQAFAAGIDAVLGIPRLASAIGIWKDARRRQGNLLDIMRGIALEFAVESLVHYGWRAYVLGEDSQDHSSDDAREDTLAEQLDAYDHREIGVTHFVPPLGDLDAVDSALAQSTTALVFGTSTSTAYSDFRSTPDRPDAVLDLDVIGDGFTGGHAQRIAARWFIGGVRQYLVQNSWGPSWGGCHLPDGSWQSGCAWVTEDVIRYSWDIHGLEIRV
jgi:hypothetical protein